MNEHEYDKRQVRAYYKTETLERVERYASLKNVSLSRALDDLARKGLETIFSDFEA